VGLPDERSGETVAAYVVKADPSLSEADIRDWCRERLTGYKVPRHVGFRETLPKSNVGKVLRRVLKEEIERAGGRAA
jgi:long-chain acyl-CoA synthetase